MTDGFGNYPFGDEPFGGFGFQPPGQRAGLRRSSWASTPRAWRSDSNASVLEPLDPAEPYKATVTYNEDTATKRSATLDVANPDALRELADYVVLSLDVADDRGTVVTIPLGHYVVIGHDITMDNTARIGTVHLRDRTYLLHLTAMDPAYVVDTGEDSGAAARAVLEQHGIPTGLLNIPDSGVLTTAPIVPTPGETILSFVTTVLQTGGMYQPWAAMDHRITSRKQRDITRASPDAVYRTASGAKVVPPVREPLRDIANLYNRVVVYRPPVPGVTPAISATADVTAFDSPVHPERLAERLGQAQPVVFPLTVQAPTVADEAEALAIAHSRLAEGASEYQKLTIETYPDLTLDGHQILELGLLGPDGETYYAGNWWQRTWSLTLDNTHATVRRELNRTTAWR